MHCIWAERSKCDVKRTTGLPLLFAAAVASAALALEVAAKPLIQGNGGQGNNGNGQGGGSVGNGGNGAGHGPLPLARPIRPVRIHGTWRQAT